ncbi:hypothetical protein Desca_0184 [Desulfotomaculum nigrificans CO-1-SRB]|uniref:Uncharacterized protein n=1 Tax=Desulfotomaculum nigrificans (strain DSM 14880 / VKM B-2319 / CO-1-SRB) TaxID=868595 RepID=F6B569_DESCC|nr:hypothetical protein [Desulfotomaculum nigrificans]AEF93088.1 hypothetical protein Desca_0184 [Desulfotomaculum nigrificans CO-1-SRB]
MAMPKLADLIDEYNHIKGSITYKLDPKKLFDKTTPEVVFCEKTVGQSYFSLVRNPDFEIVFTYKTGDKTYYSRLDLNSFQPIYDTHLFLSWGPDHCELCWAVTPGCCENF